MRNTIERLAGRIIEESGALTEGDIDRMAHMALIDRFITKEYPFYSEKIEQGIIKENHGEEA